MCHLLTSRTLGGTPNPNTAQSSLGLPIPKLYLLIHSTDITIRKPPNRETPAQPTKILESPQAENTWRVLLQSNQCQKPGGFLSPSPESAFGQCPDFPWEPTSWFLLVQRDWVRVFPPSAQRNYIERERQTDRHMDTERALLRTPLLPDLRDGHGT